MSTGKAIAVIRDGKPKAEEAKAEKVGGASEKITPPVEIIRIHSALLLAAEATTGTAEQTRPYIGGVHLSRREKVGRVAAMDGRNKAFIASFEVPAPIPAFLREGITIDGDGLRKRVQMIASMSDTPMVKLTHTKGSGFALLSDEADDAIFKIEVMPYTYPDMDGAFKLNSFAPLDEDGEVKGREWEPVGINSRHLKHCGDIAKILEAGIDKKKRPKYSDDKGNVLEGGMIIRAYNSGSTDAPLVFGFDGWPGAVLVVAPMQLATNAVSRETAAIMAPAVKLTLAALRAHATRNHAWAEEATNPRIKADYEAKARGFEERVAKIVAQTQAQFVIAEERKAAAAAPKPETPPEPQPEPEPEPTPEPTPDDDAPTDEPAVKPEVRRTPIKIRKRA
jgi:hypothetical protein